MTGRDWLDKRQLRPEQSGTLLKSHKGLPSPCSAQSTSSCLPLGSCWEVQEGGDCCQQKPPVVFKSSDLRWWKGAVPGIRAAQTPCTEMSVVNAQVYMDQRQSFMEVKSMKTTSFYFLHESKCNFTLKTEGKGRIYHVLVSLNNY